MFTNIGKKIMTLAKVICVLGIIVSVSYGIVLLTSSSYYNNTTGLGIAVIIGGCLFSWIGSWALYAFGQIADDVHNLRGNGSTTYYDKPDAGEWKCSCGTINPSSALYCVHCERNKPIDK